MALIDCSECNKQVSELARTCPNCGAPVKENVIDDITEFTAKAKKQIFDSSFNDSETGKLKIIAAAIYALHILTLFFYIFPFILSIILTKIRTKQSKGTWLESHFDFHMKTIMVAIKIVVSVGLLILLFIFINDGSSRTYLKSLKIFIFLPYLPFPWLLYRGVKGAMALFDNKEIR